MPVQFESPTSPDSYPSPNPTTTTTTKRVQVRPWLPPPSTSSMPSRSQNRSRANSLTSSDNNTLPTAPSISTTRSPSPARPALLTNLQPLKLQVLDVTCSAVALSVFTPSSSSASKPPSISISLDRRPWPHVAHAGSAPAEQGTGLETTVIVYGLDPNREYEIGFEVSNSTEGAIPLGGGGGGDSQQGEEPNQDMTGEGSASSRRHSLESTPDLTAEDTNGNLDGPPPPYSPSPLVIPSASTTPIPPVSVPIINTASTHVTTSSSAASPSTSSSSPSTSRAGGAQFHTRTNSTDHLPPPPLPAQTSSEEDFEPLDEFLSSESELRSALKTLRTSSKRNEQTLLATLSSLRKSVEKTTKEDQRTRSRIVALEEAIRKSETQESLVRGQEKEGVEDRLKEVEREENEVRKALDEWKEGNGTLSANGAVKRPDLAMVEERRNSLDDNVTQTTTNSATGPSNLAELAKELDALNKAIEAVEREKADKASEVLKALEREMSVVEGELIQLDREDAHRAAYGPPGGLIPMNLPVHQGMGPPVVPPAAQPSNNSGGGSGGPFNFRWRRGGAQAQAQQQQQQQQVQQSQDPRSFGRFFRRNNPAPPVPPPLPLLSLDNSTPPQGTSSPNSASPFDPSSSSSPSNELIPPQIAAPLLQQPQQHLQLPSATNASERFQAQQQFAQAHQAQALWAQAQARSNSNPSGSSTAGVIGQGGRRRAGSLNSVAVQQNATMMGYSSTAAGAGGGTVVGSTHSNSSSPNLMNAQIHASGVQSARTSFDEPSSSASLYAQRANSPFLATDRYTSMGPEKESPTTTANSTGSPLGLGNVLRSARNRSNSTLGGDSIETTSSGKTEGATAGGGKGGSGKNWGAKLGTWSQVVGKGTGKQKGANQATAEDEVTGTNEEER